MRRCHIPHHPLPTLEHSLFSGKSVPGNSAVSTDFGEIQTYFPRSPRRAAPLPHAGFSGDLPAVHILPKRVFLPSKKSLQFPVLTLNQFDYMISTNIFLIRMKDSEIKIAESSEKGTILWENISELTASAARPAPY